MGLWHRALGGLAAVTAAAVLAPSALASTTPSLALNQSAGRTAGSTTSLGMDLKFATAAPTRPGT